MNLILENAVLIGVLGGAITGLIAFAGYQLSQMRLLTGAAACGALTVALVALSVAIETDREQIRRTMQEIAETIQENDHEGLFSFFHPNASAGVQHAKSEVPGYKFLQASVSSIRDIIVNSQTRPPTAITEFIAAFKVSSDDPQAYGAEVNARRFVKVYWMKLDERWLVQDYEHAEFMQGFTKKAAYSTDSKAAGE